MCRNIKPLYNFKPAATDDEIKNRKIEAEKAKIRNEKRFNN